MRRDEDQIIAALQALEDQEQRAAGHARRWLALLAIVTLGVLSVVLLGSLRSVQAELEASRREARANALADSVSYQKAVVDSVNQDLQRRIDSLRLSIPALERGIRELSLGNEKLEFDILKQRAENARLAESTEGFIRQTGAASSRADRLERDTTDVVDRIAALGVDAASAERRLAQLRPQRDSARTELDRLLVTSDSLRSALLEYGYAPPIEPRAPSVDSAEAYRYGIDLMRYEEPVWSCPVSVDG